jgi:hypothetical protein
LSADEIVISIDDNTGHKIFPIRPVVHAVIGSGTADVDRKNTYRLLCKEAGKRTQQGREKIKRFHGGIMFLEKSTTIVPENMAAINNQCASCSNEGYREEVSCP